LTPPNPTPHTDTAGQRQAAQHGLDDPQRGLAMAYSDFQKNSATNQALVTA